MRQARQSPLGWLVLLSGLATVVVMSVAVFPGPWHEDVDFATKECQCPVCKIAGQGLLETAANIQVAPPETSPLSIQPFQVPTEENHLAHICAARAPPV
jgi:hypothetical protein